MVAPRLLAPTAIAALVLALLSGGAASAQFMIAPPAAIRALITTTLDPTNNVVAPPSPLDGVARLIIQTPSGTFGCSGSLIAGTSSILTAAHCISDDAGNVAVTSLTATFNTSGGPVVRNGLFYSLAPDWDGDFNHGSDLAVVRLDQPVGLPGYELWTNPDPFGGVIDVAGYGLTGAGAAGYTPGTFGTLHAGRNLLDPIVWDIPGSPYAWDFDDGTADHDALCLVAGICQTGVGSIEVLTAPGDSGGPTFYLGRLLGVHSFGATFGLGLGDIDAVLNSSFGELAGDTRVTQYAAWIASAAVPEPGTILLLVSALAGLIALRRRRR